MSKTIYVVQGATGEYSDHDYWLFCAFEDKEQAEAMVERLEKTLLEYNLSSQCDFIDNRDEKIDEVKKLDPKFRCQYTGSSYFCSEIELVDGL